MIFSTSTNILSVSSNEVPGGDSSKTILPSSISGKKPVSNRGKIKIIEIIKGTKAKLNSGFQ
jgi:hypothetical protein